MTTQEAERIIALKKRAFDAVEEAARAKARDLFDTDGDLAMEVRDLSDKIHKIGVKELDRLNVLLAEHRARMKNIGGVSEEHGH